MYLLELHHIKFYILKSVNKMINTDFKCVNVLYKVKTSLLFAAIDSLICISNINYYRVDTPLKCVLQIDIHTYVRSKIVKAK